MSPRIQSLVTDFVESLTKAIQEEGAAAFAAAIGGGSDAGNAGRKMRGGSVSSGRSAARVSPKAGRRKGEKRAPEEIEALARTLLAAIKKKPGQGIEQLGKDIGVATKELALPVAKLFDAKVIKTTGQRRATKYFPR
jgi:hypothetical protein